MPDHDLSPLPGRTVLVAGVTSGTGLETARQLAERGATVLLRGRTAEETRAAADRLIATAGIDADQLHPVAADFTHLDEVESLANHVVAKHPHLDALVNNAGIAAPERHTVTTDGNEIAFQVNFLAHYLLTCLLEPALTSDPGVRVTPWPPGPGNGGPTAPRPLTESAPRVASPAGPPQLQKRTSSSSASRSSKAAARRRTTWRCAFASETLPPAPLSASREGDHLAHLVPGDNNGGKTSGDVHLSVRTSLGLWISGCLRPAPLQGAAEPHRPEA
ncbi:SDR family NAD(P)-dependent oxidoreductase [Streptomyces sp. NPDC059441]|uniref:SDR family NAD(P)-dependent oxidoreductase n=1 Tax=Streptomyces sp. NPDC059441 TaxID=3346829 RepID=UPI0036C88014